MLPEFSTSIAKSKEEALSHLGTGAARVIAGGTDLLVKIRGGERWPSLVDISSIPSLSDISCDEQTLMVGALATHAMIADSEPVRRYAQSLATACGWVGSPQIRNMATIGGNLVNASPAADSLPALLIHDAIVVLESMSGRRELPLDTFIIGPYKTMIQPDELLCSVRLGKLQGYREGYRRVTKRAVWAISRLSVAWAIKEVDGRFNEVRISIGSCTPVPFRPKRVEDFVSGREKSKETIARAVDMVKSDIVIASGMRPSYQYKIPVLEGLIKMILES